MSHARALGVLLAGGRGERLGLGHPKALATLEGETMLDRAIDSLSRVCDDVAVVAPHGLDLPIRDRTRRVFDPGEGPLAALVAGLESAPFERAFALGVDFPLMRAEAIAVLLARPAEGPALVPAPAGRPQPLAAVYYPAALAPLLSALDRGERSVSRAVESIHSRRLADAELAKLPGGLGNFFNVNSPQDLAEAAARLRASERAS